MNALQGRHLNENKMNSMDETALVNDELIGHTVTITDSTDPAWIGVTGVILDETKQTFLIETRNQRKRIAKQIATFEFNHQGKKTRIEGIRLTYRPEDRIKKAR